MSEKVQVYDDVPPTHVFHNIMKQRLGKKMKENERTMKENKRKYKEK